MNKKLNHDKKFHLGYFIISFFLVFTIMFLVLFLVEKGFRRTRIEELQKHEQSVVKLESDFIGREFSLVLSDLHYLQHAFKDEIIEPNNLDKIAANWTVFSTQRRIYDQIRYIEADGDEIIRINLDENGGYSVPENDLQNKNNRQYFTEAIKLTDGSVYVSPLDLNMEANEIEMPYKPMIRLSTPVYDNNGVLKGVIVLNYLADYMLSEFRDLASNSQGEIVLLNANGYRLSSSNPEDDWHFMFEDKKANTFDKTYPEEWLSILNGSGQVESLKGLITALPVDLSHKYKVYNLNDHDHKLVLEDREWYVVSVFERTQNNSGFFIDNTWLLLVDILKKNAFTVVLIIIFSGVIGYLVSLNRKTYSKIKYFSEYDPLTKALNRRAGITRLNKLFPTDERRRFIVSLSFVDINGLKEVNDTLGHHLGDDLIKSVSTVIKETIRTQDFLIRLGGDEFLIVFNGIGADMAESIWERIVQRYNLINENEKRPYNISVSHGIVNFDNTQKAHLDDLIKAADEKMYLEKQTMKTGLHVIK